MPHRRPQPDTSSTLACWSPRDMVIPYVLLAVSLQRAHGFLIEQKLKTYMNAPNFTLPDTSTLYRMLRQLEKDGLLLSDWEPGATGPARRVYSLTDAGRAWLDTWSTMLESYRGFIDNFFSLYTGLINAGVPAHGNGVQADGSHAPTDDEGGDTRERGHEE